MKPRRPGCRRLAPRPRPAPVLFAPGCAEGFSGGCGGDTGWALRGKGAECLRATVGGERDSEEGPGARRACPRGGSGAGQGGGKGLGTPARGMGPARLGSVCLRLCASHLCREADRTAPPRLARRPGRGSGSGGSASWEALCRAGGCGRRRRGAASSGRDLGGSGCSGGWGGGGAGHQFSFPVGPYRRRLPFPPSAASLHDRLYPAVLLFSLCVPAPCCPPPTIPGGGERGWGGEGREAGSDRNLCFKQQNRNGLGNAHVQCDRLGGGSFPRPAGPRGPRRWSL